MSDNDTNQLVTALLTAEGSALGTLAIASMIGGFAMTLRQKGMLTEPEIRAMIGEGVERSEVHRLLAEHVRAIALSDGQSPRPKLTLLDGGKDSDDS